MHSASEWEKKAAAYLKGELKKKGYTYETLALKLNEKGFNETKAGITNKLARGAFTATFFLAALAEIGCQIVRLEDL